MTPKELGELGHLIQASPRVDPADHRIAVGESVIVTVAPDDSICSNDIQDNE